MKCFAILLAVAAIASADVSSLGYRYDIPHTSYGVPSYQTGSGGSFSQGAQGLSTGNTFQTSQPHYHTGGSYQSGGSSYQTAGAAASYQQPSQSYQQSFGSSSDNTGFQTSGGNYQSASSGVGGLPFHGSGLSSSSVVQPTYQGITNQYVEKSSASKSYQQTYQQVQHQPPQVFRHFYVHQAPEEPEAPKLRQPLVLPPPQKHYKVIIIKTPTPPAPAPQYIPLQQQNEEKTIVYVLVKKPEEGGEIVYPKVAPTPPSKPEVVFVKYSGKEGAQGVINNIVKESGGHAHGAGGIFADGALSDGGASSSGEYATSGGASHGGSFGVSGGSSDSSQQVGSVQTVSQGSEGGFSSGGSSFSSGDAGFGGSSAQSVSGGSGSFSTGDASFGGGSVQGVSSDTQQQVFSLGSGQGLPHTSYGPPSFRS